jgi:ATP-dependent RNA helicase RhlE
VKFNELRLAPALVARCEALEYVEPTPIQQKAIPVVLNGSDLVGCAETGTGKTAAFLLPILEKLLAAPKPGIRVLILAPTRELALQIEASYRQLAPRNAPGCVAIIGGVGMGGQLQNLRKRPAVLVATPGRLIDHITRGTIELSLVETLVLDEADRMFDLGFLPAIKQIIGLLSKKRQTLLFSATMSNAIERLVRDYLTEPVFVEVNTRGKAAQLISQSAYPVAMESKTALLLDLLERERFERVLVFTRTRRGAERLSHILEARDHDVNRIHADRTQSQRDAALKGFRSGKTRVLVATDIAARGIDVDGVSHVINYDVPTAPEDYVHRVGRTGRAGLTGKAITLVTPADELAVRAIERLTGQPVERILLPLFGGRTENSAPAKPVNQLRRSGTPGRRSFRPRHASR